MDATVTLIVTRGPLAGRRFVFAEKTLCLIGRAHDCTISLPQEAEHLDVSRHHCLLEIAPPTLRIRDLGSRNGTYVNGKEIGQRGATQQTTVVVPSPQLAIVLIDGDEIQLGGHTAFRVCIYMGKEDNTSQKGRRSSGELRFEEPVPS